MIDFCTSSINPFPLKLNMNSSRMAELRKVEYFIRRPLSSIICKCYFFLFLFLSENKAVEEEPYRGDLKSGEANQSSAYDELAQSEQVYDPFQSVREPVNRLISTWNDFVIIFRVDHIYVYKNDRYLIFSFFSFF